MPAGVMTSGGSGVDVAPSAPPFPEEEAVVDTPGVATTCTAKAADTKPEYSEAAESSSTAEKMKSKPEPVLDDVTRSDDAVATEATAPPASAVSAGGEA